MDKVSDFFKEIKFRLTNPLLGSFLISWLIINWKVPIGLFFYGFNDTKTLHALNIDGYDSQIDLISSIYDPWYFIWMPLLYAIGYTVFFPFIRTGIYALNTLAKTKSDSWNLNISKEGKVSVARYIQLQEIYNKQTKALEELYDKESTYKKDNDTLSSQSKKLNLDIKDLKQKHDANIEILNQWENYNTTELIEGIYDLEIKENDQNYKYYYKVSITNNNILISPDDNDASKMTSGRSGISFKIHRIQYNPVRKELFLVLSKDDSLHYSIVQLLKPNPTWNILEGIQLNSFFEEDYGNGKPYEINYKKYKSS